LKVLDENVRLYQQPLSMLIKSKELNPIFKALRIKVLYHQKPF